MRAHLTAEQMQNYLVRRVSVDELGELSEHLHGCRTCYGAYLSVLQRRFPIEIDFDELGGLKGWHLEGQELADYIEGRMSELDFDYARLHLQECVACEQRVNDASRNWLEYAPSRKSTTERHPAPWREYLPGFQSTSSPHSRRAAALVLVIGFALILWGLMQLKRHEPQVAIVPVSEEPATEPSPVKETTPPKDSKPGAGSDPNRRTESLAKGQPASSPHRNAGAAERENDIETALLARALVMPPSIESFDKSPALAVRGSTTHVESFAVVSPFSTLIPDEQPTFTWTALSGAASYTVSVYDSNLHLVRASQPLTETQWSIPDRLRRGMLYTWTVTAVRDGKEIIAPALPTRAEFTVIDESERRKLNRRIKSTVSHAARGVIYAEAGLLEEAEQELRTHLTLSPTDDRAKKLLETVESWRRLGPHRPASPTTTNPAQ
jgi:hypothetical protein